MNTRQILVNSETYGIHRGKINENFLEIWTVILQPEDVILRDNNAPFTPTNPYNPATKQYVDNSVTALRTLYDPNGVNADAFDRSNHTGSIAAEFITQDANYRFVTDAEKSSWNSKEPAIGTKGTAFNKSFGTLAGTVAEGNHIHSTYEPKNVNIQSHIATKSGNPHMVTKTEVGLGNVDNTSDANKPVSTLQQTALNLKANIVDTYSVSQANALLAQKRSLDDGVFGDETDNATIESTGFLEFNGAARPWADLKVNLHGAELHPTQSPVWVNYKGGRALQFSGTADQTIYFDCQLPHSYDEGTDLEFHVHAVHQVTEAGSVIWELTFSWANIGEAFPTETTVSQTFAMHEAQDVHGVGDVATLDGTGMKISSILICSLTRKGATDTSTSASLLIGADFHHLINTIGSRAEYTKEQP